MSARFPATGLVRLRIWMRWEDPRIVDELVDQLNFPLVPALGLEALRAAVSPRDRAMALVKALRASSHPCPLTVVPTNPNRRGRRKRRTSKNLQELLAGTPDAELEPEEFAERHGLHALCSNDGMLLTEQALALWSWGPVRQMVCGMILCGETDSAIALAATRHFGDHLRKVIPSQVIQTFRALLWDVGGLSTAERVSVVVSYPLGPEISHSAQVGRTDTLMWRLRLEELDLQEMDGSRLAMNVAYTYLDEIRTGMRPFEGREVMAAFRVFRESAERVKTLKALRGEDARQSPGSLRRAEPFQRFEQVLLSAELSGCEELLNQSLRLELIDANTHAQLMGQVRRGVALDRVSQESLRQAILNRSDTKEERSVEPELAPSRAVPMQATIEPPAPTPMLSWGGGKAG